jgi:glycosyltransferase involved in cell wall biosynthesis
MGNRKRDIYYCTHSNLNDLSYGDSNNDNKFIISIPSEFNVIKIFPNRNKKGLVSLFSLVKLILKLVKLSTKPSQVFVIRGTRLGIIPSFFKKILKHTILLNVGCTPFSTIERIAFSRNPSYQSNSTVFSNILLKLDFQFEKFVVRNANAIFVENDSAKHIAKKYGELSIKAVVLPYYVQKYFLTTIDLDYDINEGKPLIIGYTGRFHKYDKLGPLIDAINILKRKGFPVLLKLVGDGPTKAQMENKVIKFNLNDNIQFLGAQPHKKVSEIIDTEHMLILPMVKNICPSTVPIKIVEGVIKGKIILTNNSGNIKSLFKPHTELVLEDFSDPKLIAEKIIEISQNYNRYHNFAQILKKKHLKKRSQSYFGTQIVKTLYDLLKP